LAAIHCSSSGSEPLYVFGVQCQSDLPACVHEISNPRLATVGGLGDVRRTPQSAPDNQIAAIGRTDEIASYERAAGHQVFFADRFRVAFFFFEVFFFAVLRLARSAALERFTSDPWARWYD
jgi:hypothetical protein